MLLDNRTASPTCVLLTVEEAAHRLGVGRTTAYALIANGQLASVRIGHLRRVPVGALDTFVTQLEADVDHTPDPSDRQIPESAQPA